MQRYKTTGVCAREILFDLDDNNIIKSVEFVGGCRGNTQGVSKLALNRPAEEVISLLEGTQCRNGTSCPDQLAKALKNAINQK